MIDKLNAIDTSNLVEKTDHNAKIENIKDKISSATELATNAALNAKSNEVTKKYQAVKL